MQRYAGTRHVTIQIVAKGEKLIVLQFLITCCSLDTSSRNDGLFAESLFQQLSISLNLYLGQVD